MKTVLEDVTKDGPKVVTVVLKSVPAGHTGLLERAEQTGIYKITAEVRDPNSGKPLGVMETYFQDDDVSFIQVPVESKILRPDIPLGNIDISKIIKK
jgi:hypothetical protein